MDRFGVCLGFALILSSASIPFAAHRYDVKARQCQALDACVHSFEEYDIATFRLGISTWLQYFSELGLLESQYRPVRAAVLELQKEVDRFSTAQEAMSQFERDTEIRRIGESLEDLPYVGEEVVETTYAFFPFVFKNFFAMFLVVLFVIATWLVMDSLIDSSEGEMRYRV